MKFIGKEIDSLADLGIISSLNIDSTKTTGKIIDIDATTLTSGNAIFIDSANGHGGSEIRIDKDITAIGVNDASDGMINLDLTKASITASGVSMVKGITSHITDTANNVWPTWMTNLELYSNNSVANSYAGAPGYLYGMVNTVAGAHQYAHNIVGYYSNVVNGSPDIRLNSSTAVNTVSSARNGDHCDISTGANGATTIATYDHDAALAHFEVAADGNITLDANGQIKLEPASGNNILLDGTIAVDAGVVTGATSITSTAFVGTLSTATQPNIESIGTDGDTLALLGDTLSMRNTTTHKPEISLSNYTNDATGPYLVLSNQRGGESAVAGQNNDNCGSILFRGNNTTPSSTRMGLITTTIANPSAGEEASSMELQVVDGSGGFGFGLKLRGGVSLQGNVDVDIAEGASSITTVAGILHANSIIPAATAHNAAGAAVSIGAGSTTAGTTNNIAGGALTIHGGQGKGTGLGGIIDFKTASSDGDTSGSSLNALSSALILGDTQHPEGTAKYAAFRDLQVMEITNPVGNSGTGYGFGNAPNVYIINTSPDSASGVLTFKSTRGSAAVNGDAMGIIDFIGDNDAEEATTYGRISTEALEVDDTDEAGKMKFWVAESNGSVSHVTAGLEIAGSDNATDGEVNVTLAAGAASTTTIAGTLTMGSTAAMTNAGLLSVANQSNITGVGTISSGEWRGTAIAQSYLSGQSGTNTGDETLSSINGLGITTVGTIDTGVWNANKIAEDKVAQSQIVNLKGYLTLAANYFYAEDHEDAQSPFELDKDYGSATIGSGTEVTQSSLFRAVGFHVPFACELDLIQVQASVNNAAGSTGGTMTVAVVEYRPSELGADQSDYPRTIFHEVEVDATDNNNKIKTVNVSSPDNTAIPAGSHLLLMVKGDSDVVGDKAHISVAMKIIY